MSLTEKLAFLCKNSKWDAVGADFRNQIIIYLEEVNESTKRSITCERKHAHLKKIVEFDMVHCKKNNR